MPPGGRIEETLSKQVQPVRWRPKGVRTSGQVTLWKAMVVVYTKHKRISLVCLNVTIHVRGSRRGLCVWTSLVILVDLIIWAGSSQPVSRDAKASGKYKVF